METSNVLNALNLASVGIGLTIIPKSIITHDKDVDFNVYKISDPTVTSEVIFKYRKDEALPPHVLSFIEIARKVMNEER